MLKNKNVLLVGGHPDDIEVMCGGTLSKYQEKTSQVNSVIFAPCLEDPHNEGILQEYQNSMSSLGVYEAINHSFTRDILEQHIQEIRDILHHLQKRLQPDVVFCPSINDLHQDHRAVASACQTIFRDSATVLSGEVMRSTVHFTPNLYVALTSDHMASKVKLLSFYKTQIDRVNETPKLKLEAESPRVYTGSRTYFTPEIVESMARYRGVQVSTLYAEAFEIWRMTDR